MTRYVFKMPDLGEGTVEAEVVAWHVKPGDVIVHRGHHWHAVVPPRLQRRIVLQTFSTKKQYDIQMGHTQLSDATVALIPPERQKYLQWYSKPQ